MSRVGDFLRKAKKTAVKNVIPIAKTGIQLAKITTPTGAAMFVVNKTGAAKFVLDKVTKKTPRKVPRKIPVYTPENPKKSEYEKQPGYYEPKSGNTYTPENPKRSPFDPIPTEQSLQVVSPNYQKNYPDKSDNKKPLALAALGLGLGLAYYLNR